MLNSNLGELTTPMGTSAKRVQKKLAGLAAKYASGGGVDKVHKVMGEFERHKLHSGSKNGPKVTNRKQAIAIALSEERARLKGKYAKGGSTSWWNQLVGEVKQIEPRSPIQRAVGGSVSAAKAREIAHEVLGEHVKFPAPMGHKGLGKMIQKGKK